MKKPPRFILWLGSIGSLAALFNLFRSSDNWYLSLIGLVASLSLIFAYYDTLKRSKTEE